MIYVTVSFLVCLMTQYFYSNAMIDILCINNEHNKKKKNSTFHINFEFLYVDKTYCRIKD